MAARRTLFRRTVLQSAATAALPLVHIRSAGAAGTLKIATGSNLTPGADEVRRKAIEQWAAQTKTEVQVDFLSQTGNQIGVVVAAEAQAKTGHDIALLGYGGPVTYAHLLASADDVIGWLTKAYGPVN